MTTQELATRIRAHVMRMAARAKAPHTGSCLSCLDLLAVLYGTIKKPADIFILSKGHASKTLYAVLAETGVFPVALLDGYGQSDSPREGQVSHRVPGVAVSTGSLGHGLPIGCGMALADRTRRVFVLLGDGECQEGSVWEAAMFAAHHGLTNLCAIIDRNQLQACDSTENILRLYPLADKWRAFGWDVIAIDGHSHNEIQCALAQQTFLPLMVIANTVKGNGWAGMEGKVACHYAWPTEGQA